MLQRRIFPVLVGIFLLSALPASADWKNLMNKAADKVAKESAPLAGESYTPYEAVAGVREILTDSTEYASQTLTTGKGYAADAATALSLPDWLTNVPGSDKLLSTMNGVAQKATPEAEASFLDAIKDLSVPDTASLLGSSASSMTACTDYLESKSRDSLKGMVEPIVAKYAESAGMGSTLATLSTAAQVTGNTSFDLNDYLSDKVLDGMFHYMGVKETELRQSGGAGASALLQKIL
ncbi:DUF4197 domain-containing protein [Pseudodesulfovibrio sp.]|uniref:DUF4197 domain-containing protein n=1 Tax=unclassified Pseudodesulfovibrio TaxID=2661612 RepID=UPI003B003F00